MKKLDCIIADDEKPAREVLENYISRTEVLNLLAVCKNALEVFDFLQKRKVDVLFIDIQMPQLTGMGLVRSLAQPPHVIFTTAYKDYAIEAFELRAADYLLKPFSFERFLQAVDKVTHQDLPLTNPTPEHIELKVERKVLKISVNDILYVEAVGNYVKVHIDGKTITSYNTIRNITQILPEKKSGGYIGHTS